MKQNQRIQKIQELTNFYVMNVEENFNKVLTRFIDHLREILMDSGESLEYSFLEVIAINLLTKFFNEKIINSLVFITPAPDAITCRLIILTVIQQDFSSLDSIIGELIKMINNAKIKLEDKKKIIDNIHDKCIDFILNRKR
jgi:hypothetical protein